MVYFVSIVSQISDKCRICYPLSMYYVKIYTDTFVVNFEKWLLYKVLCIDDTNDMPQYLLWWTLSLLWQIGTIIDKTRNWRFISMLTTASYHFLSSARQIQFSLVVKKFLYFLWVCKWYYLHILTASYC